MRRGGTLRPGRAARARPTRRKRAAGDPRRAGAPRRRGGNRNSSAPEPRRRLPAPHRFDLRARPGSMTPLRDASVLLERRYRLLARQPIWIVIMLVQPFVWLLLYSQLLARLPELANAGAGSYIELLTPGIAVLG